MTRTLKFHLGSIGVPILNPVYCGVQLSSTRSFLRAAHSWYCNVVSVQFQVDESEALPVGLMLRRRPYLSRKKVFQITPLVQEASWLRTRWFSVIYDLVWTVLYRCALCMVVRQCDSKAAPTRGKGRRNKWRWRGLSESA